MILFPKVFWAQKTFPQRGKIGGSEQNSSRNNLSKHNHNIYIYIYISLPENTNQPNDPKK